MAVDDSPGIREALQLLLGPRYETVSLDSGDGLLEEVEAYEPDLIIMDVALPGKDGYALCRLLRSSARHRHLPVLFLTASADPGSYARCLEAAGDGFISKPIDPEELMRTIEQLLAR